MKGPTRPAPSVPGLGVNRYSPVTNWNDDPFGADLFEPAPYVQKKMPPPRPPPPRVNSKQPDVPAKPSHFVRRPTVLSSLLSRKKNTANNQNNVIQQSNSLLADLNSEVDASKVFPKCEPKNIHTGTLIDLSSPPSSPTFTTRSSSDGLSVDSFGSDATTSTNHHHHNNGGNASQAESGFEDDFDLFLSSRKTVPKDDTFDDFTTMDPFSPQPVSRPPIKKKPVLSKDRFEMASSTNQAISAMKGPTIIRAKPARPKPPDNSALLKNTLGNSFPVTTMTINTTTPIQKISNGFSEELDSKAFSWDSSPVRESSPPMPSVPPPPPPPVTDEDLPVEWPEDLPEFNDGETDFVDDVEDEKPYAIALFDYFTDHQEDLCFSANTRINLIRRVDAEWLYGSVRGGGEGLFPASYVDVRVPLANEHAPPARAAPAHARALYDFEPAQPGDLRFRTGDTIQVLEKLSDEWYFGECNGVKGQFPVNYVQMS